MEQKQANKIENKDKNLQNIESTESKAKAPSKAEKKAAEKQAKQAKKAKAVAAKKAKKQAKQDKERAKEQKKSEARAAKKAARAAKGPTVWNKIGTTITTAAAAPVFLHDKIQDASDNFLIGCGYSLATEYHDMRVRYKGSSEKIVTGLFALIIMVCGVLLTMQHYTVYEYAYNGRVLGYVKSEDSVVGLLDVAGDHMSSNNDGAHIKFIAGNNVTFRKVSAAEKDLDDADTVMNKLTYMTDIEVSAYGIYQDGKLLTVVETKGTADSLVNETLAHYKKPAKGMRMDQIKFAKQVEVKQIDVMLTSVQSKKQASEQLLNGGVISMSHIIKAGENVNSVAKKYDVNLKDMSGKNSEQSVNDLKSGDLVNMEKTVTPLEVRTVESGKMSEPIPYETEKQETKDLYKGESLVAQEGVEGRQIVSGTITKVNGKEVKRNIKHKEVVSKPVKKIIKVGINDKPKTASSGAYAVPIKNAYVINSNGKFGSRWGRMHEGLDFSCPTGTPIYAADGGTVTKAATFGGYGNCVIIKHDNGQETLYGHCSKLNVTAGEKVYKGQVIAAVGNTGRSTGAHLHFEIHIGGSAVDPWSYIF
jgi:peptidase M23B